MNSEQHLNCMTVNCNNNIVAVKNRSTVTGEINMVPGSHRQRTFSVKDIFGHMRTCGQPGEGCGEQRFHH